LLHAAGEVAWGETKRALWRRALFEAMICYQGLTQDALSS
jgi:hypothetical protein